MATRQQPLYRSARGSVKKLLLAVGMEEGLNEDYLRYRLRTAEYMGEKMKAGGVAIVEPTGGHAVYLDARDFLPHLGSEQYPAWSLCNALYLKAICQLKARAHEVRGVKMVKQAKYLRHFTAEFESA